MLAYDAKALIANGTKLAAVQELFSESFMAIIERYSNVNEW
jgi:hypothetical protein